MKLDFVFDLMSKQLNKLKAFLDVCILQSIVENEGKQNDSIPKIPKTIPKIKCM